MESPSVSSINDSKVRLLKNFIPITVYDTEMYAMINSESDICVINSTVFSKYKHVHASCKILPSDKPCIVIANSKKVPITGMSFIEVQIGKTLLNVKFYIVDNLLTDIIFGLDFLKEHDISINFVVA